MIDPTLSSAASVGANPAAPASSALGDLGSDAFLKLMVAQLKYQDPMAPADGAAMMQQTAQFTQVETLRKLASVQEQLVGLQQTSMAAAMIGRQVDAVTETGQPLQGTVDAVRFTESGPLLIIGGEVVPFAQAREIRTS